MKKGYSNKLLEVDLSNPKIKTTNLNEIIGKDWSKKWVGGAGIGVYLIAKNVPPDSSPYSEKNMLVISPGPMTGSIWPSSGRVNINAKSPATGGIGDASMGGMVGPYIKYANLDAISITGRSNYSNILVIDAINNDFCLENMYNSGFYLNSLSKLKDKNVFELGFYLFEYYGYYNTVVLAAGPAGRKGVPFSCLTGMHWDDKHGVIKRQAGRTGMGAVMASKGLEAIVIRSEKISHEPANPEEFKKNSRKLYKFLNQYLSNTENPHFLRKEGTPFLVEYCNTIQTLPAKNFKKGAFENYEGISAEAIKDTIGAEPYNCCKTCNIKCGKISTIDDKLVDLEYETIGMLGPNLEISDIKSVARAALLCDKYGLDTISTGNAIGFAIECKEKGLLNKERALELGIPLEDLAMLRWGNNKDLTTLVEKTANREGIGAFLSRGVKYMSSLFPGSENFAMHSKGLECSAYVTTNAPLMTLSFNAGEQRGADHKSAWVITAERAGEMNFPIFLFFIKLRRWFDMAVLDKLPWIDFPHPDSPDRRNMVIADLYKNAFNAMTGTNYQTVEDMTVPAERMYNLTRAFNIKAGFTKESDIPNPRMLKHAYPNKTNSQAMSSYKKLLKKFYKSWAWSKKGIPKSKTIKRLALKEIVKDI